MVRNRLAFVLGTLGVASLLVVGCSKSAPETDEGGMAAGIGSKPAAKLWSALAKYEKSHLRTWKGAFANPSPTPRDVLDAFNEVGYATTGVTGFWRGKVHNQWFGCSSDAGAPACVALKSHNDDFAKWDKFQTKIGELSSGKEKRFLAKNAKKMLTYLETYVPTELSESGMKSTGFYKKHLAGSMDGASMGDDDL